ncbi:MAG: hypothetical protein ACI3ZN_05810 [Candidatus Cryptobacteroides sp.]
MPATDRVGCGVPPGAVAKQLGVESRTTATAGVGGSTPSAPTTKRLGNSESFCYFSTWFRSGGDDGGHVILSKNKLMHAYYSPMPSSLSSELTVKRTYEKYDYISPYQVYLKIQVSKTLKRNGLKKSFRGFREVDVIRHLLSEPIYETLWKQILKFKKRDYKVENIGLWFDTLHHCVFTNEYYNRKNSLIRAVPPRLQV